MPAPIPFNMEAEGQLPGILFPRKGPSTNLKKPRSALATINIQDDRAFAGGHRVLYGRHAVFIIEFDIQRSTYCIYNICVAPSSVVNWTGLRPSSAA